MRKLTTEQFIQKAKIKHGDKYDYSKVNYTGYYNKVIIICPIHGEFNQVASNHLQGQGCPKCKGDNNIKVHLHTKEKFVKSAIKKHGDKYDYSKVNYIRSNKKIIIICPIHGEFKQKPNTHLNGRGCPKCGIIQRAKTHTKTNNFFIKQAKIIHGNKYDYSLTQYKNSKCKVKIICRKHGIFEQMPFSHLYGKGCEKCGYIIVSNKLCSSKDEFIKKAKKIHGNNYDYSEVNYKNQVVKVKIFCKKCKQFFYQSTQNHLLGFGCSCHKSSRGEKFIEKYLIKNNIIFIKEQTFETCKNKKKLRFDFYLPKYNLCIEFDGIQHFKENSIWYTKEVVINDNIKNNFCKNNNINFLRINYKQITKIDNILNTYLGQICKTH
jgi:very-short-patch-repair endonuclease